MERVNLDDISLFEPDFDMPLARPTHVLDRVKEAEPGPATLLSKGYASLFQKTLRKGLFLCFLYVLDFGKKGPFFKECHA